MLEPMVRVAEAPLLVITALEPVPTSALLVMLYPAISRAPPFTVRLPLVDPRALLAPTCRRPLLTSVPPV